MTGIPAIVDPARLDATRPLALVTGGGSGIGLAIVQDLARDREVVALGRDPAKLARLAGRPHVHPVSVDLQDPAALARLAATLPRMDLLVHCAAVSDWCTVETSTLANWHTTFATNVFAPGELTRLLLPQLRAARGQVVFISSGAGVKAVPGHVVYSASKFALRALADALRLEEVGNGIRVATVAPGPTDTAMSPTPAPPSPDGARSVPASHAAAVRLVADMRADSQVTEVVVRPRLL